MKKNEGLFINGNFFPLTELKNPSLQNILEMFLEKKIKHNDKIEIVYPFKGG